MPAEKSPEPTAYSPTPRIRKKIRYEADKGEIKIYIDEEKFPLDLAELSFDVKVLAAIEGVIHRLRASETPKATLRAIQEGKWPVRRSSKPKQLPARVQAVMEVEDITEKEARDYLASVKGGKIKPALKQAYHRIMAERIADD